MKKDLNIEEKCQRAIVVKPVNWEQRIGKEKAQRDFAVSMALQRLTPIDSRSGRIGYVHVCEEGEELRQPQFKVGTYENGTFIPQAH